METANERIYDALVGHQIDTIGYGNNIVRRLITLLNKVDADLMVQVTTAIERLPASQFNVDRLEQLLVSLRALNAKTYGDATKLLEAELQDFVEYEATYQQKLLSSVQPAPVFAVSADAVYAAAMSRPFQGKLLKEWMAGLEDGKAALIRDAIRIGYVESQTTSDIIKRIRGTRALKYSDGLLEITRRNAQSVVLTALNHTANFTREMVYERNSDVVKAQRYTATLDSRTTELCASRDGNIYPLGKAKPAIPAHIRCRSLYVAVLKSFKEMGIKDDDLPETTRASLDGQVPADMTYQQWLTKQSVERQNDVLGVTKAKLFRDGGLQLDRFVSKNGHVYTLAELRMRDSLAFEKAGL